MAKPASFPALTTRLAGIFLLASLLIGCDAVNEPTGLARVDALEQQGKLDEAIAEAGKLQAQSPGDRSIEERLQQLYLSQIDKAERKRDWQQALDASMGALKINPDDAGMRLKRGVFERNTGDVKASLEQLERARELGANPRDVALEMAATQLRMRQLQDVWDGLAELADTPSDQGLPLGDIGEAALYRAKAAMGLKRYDDAEALYQRLASIAEQGLAEIPTGGRRVSRRGKSWGWFRLQANLGLIEVARENKDLDAAQQYLSAALEQSPKSAQLLKIQGELAAEQDDPEAALAAYEKSLQRYPRNIRVRQQVAFIQFSRGNLEAAAEQIAAMQASHPQNVLTRRLQAELLVRQGDCQAGLAAYQNIRSHGKGDPRSNAVMAKCMLKQRQFERALEYSRNAFGDPYLHLDALAIHARALIASGSEERAWQLLRGRAKADPAVYFTGALVAMQLGNTEQAHEFLQDAKKTRYRRKAGKALFSLEQGNYQALTAALKKQQGAAL